MLLPDDMDLSGIDWRHLAAQIRRDADRLPVGSKRSAEIDRALACEALARSADVLLATVRIANGSSLIKAD